MRCGDCGILHIFEFLCRIYCDDEMSAVPEVQEFLSYCRMSCEIPFEFSNDAGMRNGIQVTPIKWSQYDPSMIA